MKKTVFLVSLLCITIAASAQSITGTSIINLSTAGQPDKELGMILSPSLSDGFDNSWDAYAANESGIYVYSGGQKFTTWASNQYTASLPLGFYTGENTSYTLKFSNFSGTEYTIYDRVADKTISVASSTNIQINGVDADPANQYTFTINESLKNSQINDRFIINPVYVEGSWNGWASWSVAFWDNGDGSVIYEVENLLANTEYDFGLHFGTQSGSWATNGYTYKSDYKSTTGFEHDVLAGNMKLQTEAAGTYTFKWEYATRTFSIIFPTPAPALSVTTNGYGFCSFASSEDVEFATGIEAYKGEYNAGTNELTLTSIGQIVPAGTGVILYSTSTNTVFNYTTGADASGVSVGTNNFVGVTTAADPAGIRAAGKEIYCLNGNALKQYVGTDDIPAGKAYLPISVGGGSNNAPKHITMRFNNTTAVDNLDVEAGNVEKFIENGQIYIRRGNEVFNMQGQIVK